VRRRTFITLLGGAATTLPNPEHGQSERVRRVGLIMVQAERDPEGEARVRAFREGLRDLGRAEGRNLH
jgi:putative tryptophan/tyrosine transport system substrate-binding protein